MPSISVCVVKVFIVYDADSGRRYIFVCRRYFSVHHRVMTMIMGVGCWYIFVCHRQGLFFVFVLFVDLTFLWMSVCTAAVFIKWGRHQLKTKLTLFLVSLLFALHQANFLNEFGKNSETTCLLKLTIKLLRAGVFCRSENLHQALDSSLRCSLSTKRVDLFSVFLYLRGQRLSVHFHLQFRDSQWMDHVGTDLSFFF
jgi:hypothetical protein